MSKKSAQKLVIFQAVIALILAVLLLFWGGRPAYSALVAGVICVVANSVFIYKLFGETRAQAAKKIVWNFYTGEIIKLIIIAALMIMAIKWLNINIIPAVLAYFVLQLSMLFAPMSALKTEAAR